MAGKSVAVGNGGYKSSRSGAMRQNGAVYILLKIIKSLFPSNQEMYYQY
jgi:hypothetical protein